MGPGRRVEAFRLGGSLMLTGEQRLGLGFRSDVIGLSDNQTGLQGRSVWTDERGDQVFSELSSATTGPGNVIQGRIVGRHRPLCRRQRRLQLQVAPAGRLRGRQRERARR